MHLFILIGSDSEGELVVTATRKPQLVKRAMFVMLGNLNPQSSLSEKFKQTLLDKCTVKFRHASSGEEIGKCPGPTLIEMADFNIGFIPWYFDLQDYLSS